MSKQTATMETGTSADVAVDWSKDKPAVTGGMPADVATLQSMLTAANLRLDEANQKLAQSVPMILAYQNYIPAPPVPKEGLWQQACSNDKITSDSWRETWLNHIERNVAEFDADNHIVSDVYGEFKYRPAIIAGSGPSLKKNVDVLAASTPKEFPIVSCLHNFGLFVDRKVPCDWYVTLDAGSVTIPEMTEGGSEKDKTKYMKASENKTLITALVSPPELLRMWKGRILFFNATIPDAVFMERMPKMTKNKWVYSVGGNTLGACFYHAAFVFGCNPIALVGADFSFDYMHKFHAWDSGYDSQFSGIIPMTDVFGNRVYTWQSYANFKAWFEFQAMGGQSHHNVQLINCTEGGTLGAYPHGNIMAVRQMHLASFLNGYRKWEVYKDEIGKVPENMYTVMC